MADATGAAAADDLDQLLDSALVDFTELNLASKQRVGSGEGEDKRGKDAMPSSSPSTPVRGLGLGVGLPDPKKGKGLGLGMELPDPKSGKKGKQRVGRTMGSSHASEALEKLTQQTREAVMALGAASMGESGDRGDEMNTERMVEDFVKQFEQMSGSKDMESVVETMMRQLLSREILHEPMKEIAERYPKWLEEHKPSLDPEEYSRYVRQYEFITKLNEVYENDSDNFPKIVELMQSMQECGQPPHDIVRELAPGLDFTNLGNQMAQEMMLEPTSNCSIM